MDGSTRQDGTIDLTEIVARPVELSVVLPCLDEAETIEVCVTKAQASMAALFVVGEVVVADNGSTDGSQEIARRCGARVVAVPERGYGAALRAGIAVARGEYVIMADADDSYSLDDLGPFVQALRDGHDLVMGNRFQGGIQPGAMPKLHRYLGNPVLSFVGRLFFKTPVGDFHCGMRGFRRDRILELGLRTTGMEFASEMVVKASLNHLDMAEVPTMLAPDGRSRRPHLRTWRDGWRHLRFLLAYSPRWLFLYPGLVLMAIGTLGTAWLLPGAHTVGGIRFDLQSLLYFSMAIVLGFQSVCFAVFSKVFAIRAGLLPADVGLDAALRRLPLERMLVVAGVLVLAGIVGTVATVANWSSESFGALDIDSSMRASIASLVALVIGVQLAFSSFFLSLLQVEHRG